MKRGAARMPPKANMRDDDAAAGITQNDETRAPLRRRKAHIRESNEAHLLACAEAVFAERGLDGASTAMIAERAGLPKANVHYYFPTKLALYRRVLEDLFEDWHRAAATFECSDDPVDAIGGYDARENGTVAPASARLQGVGERDHPRRGAHGRHPHWNESSRGSIRA